MTIVEPEQSDVPEGFKRSDRGPFSSYNGPLYDKQTSDGRVHGFRVLKRHCNGHGILHGGMMMAFMDGVLANAVWEKVGGGILTLRMNSDFVAIGRPNDWVEGRADVTKVAKSVVYVRGKLTVGRRTIMSANAVFKVMRRRTKASPGEAK